MGESELRHQRVCCECGGSIIYMRILRNGLGGPVEQILLFDDVRRQCGDHVAECGGLQLPELLIKHDVC